MKVLSLPETTILCERGDNIKVELHDHGSEMVLHVRVNSERVLKIAGIQQENIQSTWSKT